MTPRKLTPERETNRGWSPWLQPIKRGYRLHCCDCGLVHFMQFRIVDGRVQFKAKRDPATTVGNRSGIKRRANVRAR